MNRAERAVRLLPAPLKAAAKSARHAVDPAAMTLYRRRTGNQEAIPPSAVRARTGSASIPAWVEGGAHHADDLEAALGVVGHSFSDFEAILDFGCGSGRVLRHVMGRGGPETRYAGSDVDAEAVAWANRISGGDLARQPLPPAAALRRGRVRPRLLDLDLHPLQRGAPVRLDRRDERGSCARAASRAALGARLPRLRGVHVGRLVSNSPSCARRVMSHHSLAEERFVYEPYEIGAWNQHDFPGIDDTFGMAFHSRAYLEEDWTEDFALLDVLPRASAAGRTCPSFVGADAPTSHRRQKTGVRALSSVVCRPRPADTARNGPSA